MFYGVADQEAGGVVSGRSATDTPLTLFASDNYAGAHPAVLEAVAAANDGWARA